MLIYTAGPYSESAGTGTVDENITRARDVAVKLWDMGYSVICPHMNTAGFEKLTSLENKQFVDRDLEMVQVCDGIVMLPYWQQSRGAIRELEHARQYGLQVWMWPGVPESPVEAQKNRSAVKADWLERFKQWFFRPGLDREY